MFLDFLAVYWWVFALFSFGFVVGGFLLQLRAMHQDLTELRTQSLDEGIIWRFGPPVISVLAGFLSFFAAVIGLITAFIQRMN